MLLFPQLSQACINLSKQHKEMNASEPKHGLSFLARQMTSYLEKNPPSLHLSMLDDDRLIDP